MEKVDLAKEELFKLLDVFAAGLAARGLTRAEVAAAITLDKYEIADTVSKAFGE